MVLPSTAEYHRETQKVPTMGFWALLAANTILRPSAISAVVIPGHATGKPQSYEVGGSRWRYSSESTNLFICSLERPKLSKSALAISVALR
jgi:hypothetical protein